MQATSGGRLKIVDQVTSATNSFFGWYQPMEPLLSLAMTQTRAQGVYVYRFDRAGSDASLAVWAGLAPIPARGVRFPIKSRVDSWHLARWSPVVLQDNAWDDWRFEELPEFKINRFEGVVSIPLLESGDVVGMANFCRSHRASLPPRDLSLLLGLSLPLAALLTGPAVREKLERTTQQLADRKVLDRAKGLLQLRFGWSEEQAYFHLRRSSRQRRIPMRQIALEAIEAGVPSPQEAPADNGD
jgi:hypothetical protein